MNIDALAEFRETPDYLKNCKNCSPSCTSCVTRTFFAAFCRSKLILLLLTRARRDATSLIVPYCILIRYRTVRIYRKTIFCIETRLAVSVDLSRPAEETQGYSTVLQAALQVLYECTVLLGNHMEARKANVL